MGIVAVFNDKLVVGAPYLHVDFGKLFNIVVGEVDEDRLVNAVGRIGGVGIGIPEAAVFGCVFAYWREVHSYNQDVGETVIIDVGQDAAKPAVIASYVLLVEVSILVDVAIIHTSRFNACCIEGT